MIQIIDTAPTIFSIVIRRIQPTNRHCRSKGVLKDGRGAICHANWAGQEEISTLV